MFYFTGLNRKNEFLHFTWNPANKNQIAASYERVNKKQTRSYKAPVCSRRVSFSDLSVDLRYIVIRIKLIKL